MDDCPICLCGRPSNLIEDLSFHDRHDVLVRVSYDVLPSIPECEVNIRFLVHSDKRFLTVGVI